MNHDLDVILRCILNEIVTEYFPTVLEFKKLDEDYAYLITVKQDFSTFRWVTSHGFHNIFTVKPVGDHMEVITELDRKTIYDFKFEDIWTMTKWIRYNIKNKLDELIDPPRKFTKRPDGPSKPPPKTKWNPFADQLPPTSAEWHAIDRLATLVEAHLTCP